MSEERLITAREALASAAPNEFAAYEEVEAELEAAVPDEGAALMAAVFKAEVALAALAPDEFAAYERAEAAYKETLMMRGVFKAEAALAAYEKTAAAYREMSTEESCEASDRLWAALQLAVDTLTALAPDEYAAYEKAAAALEDAAPDARTMYEMAAWALMEEADDEWAAFKKARIEEIERVCDR